MSISSPFSTPQRAAREFFIGLLVAYPHLAPEDIKAALAFAADAAAEQSNEQKRNLA